MCHGHAIIVSSTCHIFQPRDGDNGSDDDDDDGGRPRGLIRRSASSRSAPGDALAEDFSQTGNEPIAPLMGSDRRGRAEDHNAMACTVHALCIWFLLMMVVAMDLDPRDILSSPCASCVLTGE